MLRGRIVRLTGFNSNVSSSLYHNTKCRYVLFFIINSTHTYNHTNVNKSTPQINPQGENKSDEKTKNNKALLVRVDVDKFCENMKNV